MPVLEEPRVEALDTPPQVRRHTGLRKPARSILRADFATLALVFVEVALIALVLQRLDMQTSAFRRVVYVAAVGFLVHHLLPIRLRLPFFAALGIGSMFLVLGGPDTYLRFWDVGNGIARAGAVLIVGLISIGVCRLPIGFWRRVGLLLAVGGVAAAFRGGLIPSGRLAVAWPVLAALFMFRIAIYLYDVSSAKSRPPLTQALAYFFLLPNACCTLFPVVDYTAFGAPSAEPPLAICRRGARWMARGLLQLVAYRLVDQLFALTAAEVASGSDLVQFIVTNMLRYLKVSGSFHMIIGMLLLFGFSLPAPNHRYFLASSFTDYWRRVNIYWKDFLVKVVYYPIFFRLKRFGMTPALVIATLGCFLVTWALHLYQTWWLTGAAAVTWPDVLFWLILGLLVMVNALWEMKRGRRRRLVAATYNGRVAAGLALRTAATFACVSLLWSLWSTPSLSLWLGLWRFADRHTLLWGAVALGGIMLATLAFEVAPVLLRGGAAAPAAPPRSLRRDLVVCAVPLLLLYLGLQPALQARLDDPRLQPLKDALATGDSMIGDFAAANRGYYDRLTSVDEGSRQLWETFMRQRIELPYAGVDPVRPVQDLERYEPLPGVHLQAYQTDFETNRWGMRDRDYALVPPPGTLRMALLGSSNVMGWGVPREATFKARLEQRLNRAFQATAGGPRVEILNFAFNGYTPLGQVAVLQSRVRPFHPEIVLFVAHLNDFEWVVENLSRALREHVPVPEGKLQRVLGEARVGPRTHKVLADRRLRPFEAELTAWCYERLVRESRAMGALPVWIFMPLVGDVPVRPERVARLSALAAGAGFVVLDLSHAYDGHEPGELALTDLYHHDNATAHALIADALYQALSTDPRIDLADRVARASAAVEPAASPHATRRLAHHGSDLSP